ncbi:MAG TPA: transcriptional regulator NrdR [Pirellulales bacterium]|jgi:transcriptional repressor NrdR|nr:transcriptional regulator NrdR [Pirellulales bacterium]
MQCPFCRRDNDRVIDSRASDDGFAIRRRRECTVCKRRYTTYERVEEPSIKVVKKDGVREPFSREKIKNGLQKACWKRPVGDEQIEAIVATVENDIYANFDNEVSSRHLGDLLMEQLRELDQVAFVRFASVYRQFKDVRDFVEELGPMLAAERSSVANRPRAPAGEKSGPEAAGSEIVGPPPRAPLAAG